MSEMSMVETSDEGEGEGKGCVAVDEARSPKNSEHASRGMHSRDPALHCIINI
jgi:hypothetical protein